MSGTDWIALSMGATVLIGVVVLFWKLTSH